MEKNIKESNIFFTNKYILIYICLSSLFACFILNFIIKNYNINVLTMFRIYYIVLSIVLFVLIEQVRKFYSNYISKIVVVYFGLMIFISGIAVIVSISEKNVFQQYGMSCIISASGESILLLETFCAFILSEYYFNHKELRKEIYYAFILAIIALELLYCFKVTKNFTKILDMIIETILFMKIILNMKSSGILKKIGEYKVLSFYIYSTIIIWITRMYVLCYGYNNNLINVLIEFIHLVNFRIAWNFIIIKLIREPYKNLSNSLNEKNKELDKLNYKIVIGNMQLESSINLLKSKEYLNSTFFRFMPHPILILNADNDRILFANKQFLNFSGINKARDIVNEKVKKYIEFMPENKDYNAIFYIGDTRKFIQAKFLENYSDSAQKLILIKDNTSKVQTEEIRKEVENKKIQENIRTEFLSSISHDLKTPINVIYSATQVEEIYIKKNDLQVINKYNSICKQNCIALIKLTNNLIDNSKLNSHYLVPRLENINIVEVIEDNVMSLIDYVKWNNIDLIFDTNTEECYLNIDHEFINRIILNLVSNAVKYTPYGGKICVVIYEDDEKVNVSVKDNGSGIKQEFIYQAFNRYSVGEGSTKTTRKSGTGIGLCVVKQLVELQGGNIEIKRNQDVGTTVSMEFKKGE